MSCDPKFSNAIDVKLLKRMDAERAMCYYKARTWYVHQRDETPLNLYGEPGRITTSINGVDGVTSVPASRVFTSAGSDFITAGVRATDILEIDNQACDTETSTNADNGRYSIVSVDSATELTIDRDWPAGSQDTLDFKIQILKERYVEFGKVPFLVKLEPTEKQLSRWGIDEKRDALIEMSIGLLEDIGLVPKIGDRFDYPYGQPSSRVIQYEVKNLFETDQYGDSCTPLHYIGLALRTTSKLI